MSKEQKSNREKKKPKQDKSAKVAARAPHTPKLSRQPRAPINNRLLRPDRFALIEQKTTAIVPPISFGGRPRSAPRQDLRQAPGHQGFVRLYKDQNVRGLLAVLGSHLRTPLGGNNAVFGVPFRPPKVIFFSPKEKPSHLLVHLLQIVGLVLDHHSHSLCPRPIVCNASISQTVDGRPQKQAEE